jgi:DNA-binding NtrC family response regulator
MTPTLLIVEDDGGLRSSLERSLSRRGLDVVTASTVAEARQIIGARSIDLVLLDLRLPDGPGLDVLLAVRDVDDRIPVIVMTAFPEVQAAVRAMKEGARDFIVKPFELEEMHLSLDRALETRDLRRSVLRLEREQRSRNEITELLGSSPAIEHVREQVRKVADTTASVLVAGETGTGKELVTESIHRLSPRRDAPLVKVNCSAFSEQLLESELFGHEKGAFTDAKAARTGLFEMSDGGTLFLDEISEMKPGLQAKLLRVVEGHPFHRVGGHREVRTDVRVVAATNQNLVSRIEAGEFRKDLYFRLNVFRIEVPPLRDRGRDAVEIGRRFLERSAATLRKKAPRLAPETEDVLLEYDWPGNVRELSNVMERAVILCDEEEVRPAHLPAEIRAPAFVRRAARTSDGGLPSLDEIERRYMAFVLDSTDGSISEAARVLGISRNTLKARLRPARDQ